MPLIPESELTLLKSRVSIEDLIRRSGVELRPAGADLRGLCPFHAEKTPSFTVTPAKGLYHCFGCGRGGDVFQFVMEREGVDFAEAVRHVRAFAGSTEAGDAGAADDGATVPVSHASLTAADAELLSSVVEHYHKTLKNDSSALRYLESRGLVKAEAILKFRVGYSDGSLSGILPSGQSKEGEAIRSLLKSVGLFRQGTGHEHFEGCITFPIFDEKGVLVGMYGRRISHKHRVKHMYLPGPHRGIWNRAAYNLPDLILCESIIDAVTFYVNGLRNVSCAYGIEGFTDEMVGALRRGDVKRLFIAYDADRPGNEAAVKLAGRLAVEAPGIECLRVKFPMGMDANDYGVRAPNAVGGFKELIVTARPVREERPAPTPAVHIEEIPAKAHRAAAAPSEPEFEVTGDEVRFAYGERRYRVRGLYKNSSDHLMKVNVRVSLGDVYHLDTFDLLSAKARSAFIEQAAGELSVDPNILKHDLGRILATLEDLQEKRIRETMRPEERIVEIPEARREKALAYLRDPQLVQNIVTDFERCGLVGERINSLIGYLGAVSRKTDSPLAIIIQSSSSAGKSTLMEAILSFVPPEDKIKFSMMTGQALYYMQSRDLKHRILAIAEEEGVERAKYAIKILQSEGRITIATTIKDPVTGLPDTKEFEVEGPVMILLTTTNAEIDEELLNRCLVITINEEREQTRLIQSLQRQRRTLEGLTTRRNSAAITELHADAQRMLRPLPVVIPFADRLDFPDTQLRMRRDHEKFLTLIETIAFLHQYQREIRTERGVEYIVASEADVALATFLAGEVFGISLNDLAPQTKKLLELIEAMVDEEAKKEKIEQRRVRFTRRQVRERLHWSDARVRRHLDRLADLEYVVVHGGGHGRLIEYELLYDGGGKEDINFVPGLSGLDLAEKIPGIINFLKEIVPPNGQFVSRNGQFDPHLSPYCPPFVATSSRQKSAETPLNTALSGQNSDFRSENVLREKAEFIHLSHPQTRSLEAGV